MTNNNIKPEKITKPIQLLGAWLAGLFSIDSCFLVAAANMSTGSWEARALVIAAIVNVPLFLLAVFLLQTKFRPELQEDSFYSTYLSQKTNQPININKAESHFIELTTKLERLENQIISNNKPLSNNDGIPDNLLFGINKHLQDIETIKSKLADLGILKISIFGGDHSPEQRNVAISQYLSKADVKKILRIASQIGFVKYSFFDNKAEYTDEDVLIGSYGNPEYEILTKNL